MPNIYVSGFGDSAFNGLYYVQNTTLNGYPWYSKNDDTYFAIYYADILFSGLASTGAYYLFKKSKTYNENYSAPVFVYKYKKPSNDITDSTAWVPLMAAYAGETTTGTIDPMSSSSSTSSYIENWSSSSSSYIENWSSSSSSSSSTSYIENWSSSSSFSSSSSSD